MHVSSVRTQAAATACTAVSPGPARSRQLTHLSWLEQQLKTDPCKAALVIENVADLEAGAGGPSGAEAAIPKQHMNPAEKHALTSTGCLSPWHQQQALRLTVDQEGAPCCQCRRNAAQEPRVQSPSSSLCDPSNQQRQGTEKAMSLLGRKDNTLTLPDLQPVSDPLTPLSTLGRYFPVHSVLSHPWSFFDVMVKERRGPLSQQAARAPH